LPLITGITRAPPTTTSSAQTSPERFTGTLAGEVPSPFPL
jgi:hypothetical protein